MVEHVFPADGEYVFKLGFASGANSRFEDVDVSVDGERVALLHYARTGGGADGRGAAPISTEPVFVAGGAEAGVGRLRASLRRSLRGPCPAPRLVDGRGRLRGKRHHHPCPTSESWSSEVR